MTYLGPTGSHIGHKETVKDTARVLGRMYDAIEYRGFGESVADELARWAGVPVYNGLTDEWHPTQILADFLTLREHVAKPLSEVSFCYMGDAHANMADSYLVGAAKMGMDLRIASPMALWPRDEFVDLAQEISATTGATITITEDVQRAVQGADAIATDVWVSMGEPEQVWAERIEMLKPYQVSAAVMAMSGNPDVKFMHCLPAFHNLDTSVGAEILFPVGHGCAGGDRRGVRVAVVDRVRRGGEQTAHDQSRARGHAGSLTCVSWSHLAETRCCAGISR